MTIPSGGILPQQKVKNDDSAAIQRQRDRNKYLYVLAFMLPGMLFFFAFLLLPVSNSLYYSTFRWDGLGPPVDYRGLANYEYLFRQGAFHQAIQNSFYVVIWSLTLQLPMALALALVVGRGKLPGRKIFRTILFVPYVFSEILTAYVWKYVLHPGDDGLFNVILHTFIPNAKNILWLADANIALFSIFLVITWKFFGLHMILYMAALQNVPDDLEDAARIDGATEMQVIQNITLPMISSTIRLTVYLSVLGSFQQFVLIWVMTEGGPAGSTHVLATYLYKFGIISWRLGLGSAIAVMLFAITFTFSVIYQLVVMRRDYEVDMVI